MSSLRMTKRQWQNIGMGMAFLVVGIIVFAVLKMMEGNIINKDGRDYIYTVDPNVFLVMFLIMLIGLLIIFLTLVEYRWQSRSGETEVNIMDLIRRKEPAPQTEPVQAKEVPDWKKRREEAARNKVGQLPKKGPEIVQAKEISRPLKGRPEPVTVKKPEPPAKAMEPALQKEPEPIRNKTPEPVLNLGLAPNVMKAPEPLPVKNVEPVQKGMESDLEMGSRPIPESVPDTIKMEGPGPKVPNILEPKEPAQPVQAQPIINTETVQKGAPVAPQMEKLVPIRVEAIGRCPMCGKVIMINQVECFKCGLKVNPKKLMPIGNRDDLN